MLCYYRERVASPYLSEHSELIILEKRTPADLIYCIWSPLYRNRLVHLVRFRVICKGRCYRAPIEHSMFLNMSVTEYLDAVRCSRKRAVHLKGDARYDNTACTILLPI